MKHECSRGGVPAYIKLSHLEMAPIGTPQPAAVQASEGHFSLRLSDATKQRPQGRPPVSVMSFNLLAKQQGHLHQLPYLSKL